MSAALFLSDMAVDRKGGLVRASRVASIIGPVPVAVEHITWTRVDRVMAARASPKVSSLFLSSTQPHSHLLSSRSMMSDAETDTDTLLAMLSSLLQPEEFEHAVLLDALVNSNGDLEAAAQALRSERPKKRRKVAHKDHTSIESWLKGEKTILAPLIPSESSAGTNSHSVAPAKMLAGASKPRGLAGATLFGDLGQANQFASTSKTRVPRLLPLTLATPELVAEHTPCTMHHSVLPPELACR